MEAIEKAAEIADERNSRREARNPELRKAIDLVYKFLQKEDLICYGGTAINNLLPKKDQFYDYSNTLPDYDMFTQTPQVHAMMLADILSDHGIVSVEVRPGVHLGTFKVFANYMGVADFTYLEEEIFDSLWKESIEKDRVHYVPPNFLRMSMYLELSRPRGDVSRWTKVYKRLQLLNDAYPIQCPSKQGTIKHLEDHSALEDFLMDQPVVLLGLHASQIHERKARTWDLPIDLLVRPEDVNTVLKELREMVFAKSVTTEEHKTLGEFLPSHIDVRHGKQLLARVYTTIACHSYHQTSDGMKIASIPTILQFFMGFLYADSKSKDELDPNRISCVAQRLVDLMSAERHKRRFAFLAPLDCMGDQGTLADVRLEKAKIHDELLKTKGRDSPDFLKYFFTYAPSQATKTQKNHLRSILKKTYRNRRTSRN